jgi:hypothetical protein
VVGAVLHLQGSMKGQFLLKGLVTGAVFPAIVSALKGKDEGGVLTSRRNLNGSAIASSAITSNTVCSTALQF